MTKYTIRYKGKKYVFDDPYKFIDKMFEIFREEREEEKEVEVRKIRRGRPGAHK